jgi:NTE family protein
MNSLHHQPRTALVLGGGGSTGNAWLIGVLAGLADAGLDPTTADLTIGTSAGATAAAQLTGACLHELLAATLIPIPPRAGGGRAHGPVADHLGRLRQVIADSGDVADMRRRMGAAALDRAAASDGSWQAQWRATVAARLPGARWPERALWITAVDARSGEPVIFDRTSGVDIVDAVAASTSGGGEPYRIGEDWYIDGGYRSNAENADLAAGFERVLVLSPLGGRSLHPEAWGTHLAAQVDELSAAGSEVQTVFPGADSEHMFGANAMDLSLRAAAARAGFDQGRTLAERLRNRWRISDSRLGAGE